MNPRFSRKILLGICALLLSTVLVVSRAAAAEVYDLSWWTVDGGGATASTGGSYSLDGSIGQPAAGTSSGGTYTLVGGFWGGIYSAPTVTTDGASSITSTGATLNGTVNANAANATVTFEYGLNTSYGTTVTADESPVAGITNTPVSKAITGLTPNMTYHYRVLAVNHGGTTRGADQTFTTNVIAPSATTNTATSIIATGATLNGTVNAHNASSTVTFEYGLTESYGSTVTADQSPVTGAEDTAVSKALSGLAPNTTYHYRVVAENTAGPTTGGDQTFTTSALAPAAATDAATSVTANSATLNGTVNANNASSAVTFEYGLTDSYGAIVAADQSPVTGRVNTAVSAALTNLTPNTTYHYRVVAVNIVGTTNGSDQTFTTSLSAPTATTDTAIAVTATGATLKGTVNANNDSSTVTFEYGLTASYGSTVTADESPVTGATNTAVSKAITGLIPNTTYHYRVIAVNSAGTTTGSDQTFATSVTAPTATTNAAASLTATDATLNGTVNAHNASSAVTFEYGADTSYGTTITADQSPVTGSTDTPVSKAITGLTPNTTYHYRVAASNSAGTTYGADLTFTTVAIAPTAITDDASSITPTSATLNGVVNANNASATVTFEYGLTVSYGSTVTADQSPVIGAGATAASKTLTGLALNTTYHYRVVAVNSAGTTTGNDKTFTTGAITPVSTTNAATLVTASGATLNGTVNANNASSMVTFEYGLTIGYGSSVTAEQSPVTGTSDTAVSKAITGLLPNTTYHYRVAAVNSAGTTNGADLTFTTNLLAPTVVTDAATSITASGAVLNGTVNANNDSSTVTFEYGLDTSYGTTVTAVESPATGTTNTTASKAITGLLPNTTYHYRVVAENTAGITQGADIIFTTSALAPTVTTNAATSVTSTGATLNGMVNANNADATVNFEYGLNTSYGTPVTATPSLVTGLTNTAVNATLTGLTPNTTYHFRVSAVNSAGTTAGSDQTFTTNAAPTNITLSITSVAENKPLGTLIGTLNAVDPNVGDTFTFTLPAGVVGCNGANNASFQISSNQLKTKAVFDYETKASYNICIRANDGKGGTFNKAFIIAVTNVFDEVAKNGKFEIYTGVSKVPTNWVAGSFGTTDGKDLTAGNHKEGLASVKILGATGKTKTLTQTLVFSGATGNKFTFSFWVKGATVPSTGAGVCQAQVLLYNGAILKLTKTIPCPTGTYAVFQKKSLTFNATSAYTKAVIKFTYSKASGTVWFDWVSLLR